MAILSALVSFVVSLLVGSFAIYVAAGTVADVSDFGRAVATAFVGAIVWVVVGALLGWIPLLGPIIALAAWVLAVNVLYPGDVGAAVLIGLGAWITALVVIVVVSLVFPVTGGAFGVPFV